MKVQLTLLLAYVNVAFWVWMMTVLHEEYGTPSAIEHVPLLGIPFSIWLAIRVRRNELNELKSAEPEGGNGE